ncbi:uncharacterized protein LOC134819012 [Bolinopsis microptera]|uniref:uncharacterized protein LOC134819012 n=1 Tax=Bolinopsis microptera TaxID=2820187 RepID=UPI003078B7EA
MDSIIQSLSSHKKLDRDRGIGALSRHLKANSGTENESPLLILIKGKVEFNDSEYSINPEESIPWEQLHGALQALSLYIDCCSETCSPEFFTTATNAGQQYLTHHETRVRTAAGQLLGALAKFRGTSVYLSCKSELLSGIIVCLERHEEADNKIKEKLNGDTSESVFHDTAGWGNLETNMKALECIITNTGAEFDDCIDSALLDLVFGSLSHTNRFVRETGYMVCCALVSIHPLNEQSENKGHIWSEGKRFADVLERGLSDNWSQVRMAACCATRAFLLGIPVAGRDEFYPQILPPLCLNRYYIAEGVRIHCQTTWRMLFSVTGVKAVELHLNSIVPFYIKQSEADNHAVREAACACIAELATKVGSDPVRVHVPTLIQGLLVCFEDDSWPVRDAACTACGNFVSVFAEECRAYIDRLMPLFYMNLEDNIPSVRQGAAIAISNIVRAYLSPLSNDVVAKLSELLDAVDGQEDDSTLYSDLSKKPAVFGVAMADDPAHTNQVMYSCGSLAPKMGRGGKALGAGGCSASHHFKRPSQPWERTDGAVRLFMELSDVNDTKSDLLPMVRKISSATRKRNFEHHKHLLETIYKCIPMIFRRLTKIKIKPFINDFFDGLFYGLKSDNNLLKAASVECLQSLSLLLGPNILKGRIEMTDYNMMLYVQDAFPETIGM